MKVYSCDRCGTPLTRERFTAGFRMADARVNGGLDRLMGYDCVADLCSECHDAARAVLAAFVADGRGVAEGPQDATGASHQVRAKVPEGLVS